MAVNASLRERVDPNWEETDPIWETPACAIPRETPASEIVHKDDSDERTLKVDSPRCGGSYSIDTELIDEVRGLDDHQKARLTSLLVERRRLKEECPEVTNKDIDSAKKGKNALTSDRVAAILKYLESKTPKFGQAIAYIDYDLIEISGNYPIINKKQVINYELLAHSESIDQEELISLLGYMEECELIKTATRPDENLKTFRQPSTNFIQKFQIKSLLLTVKGRIKLEEIRKLKTDSSQGFMAMWFDSSMDDVWEKAFEPGIKEAGYKPRRIDQKQHVNKIDDEIIAEIRRSRFVVADFTGARSGVYYEAGFAHGFGIKVIFTCHASYFDLLHFDIRQYNCIEWGRESRELETQLGNARNADYCDELRKKQLEEDINDTDILDDLKKNLANRISAVIGDGPLKENLENTSIGETPVSGNPVATRLLNKKVGLGWIFQFFNKKA